MNGYPTSMRYSRTMRLSGTAYAASIERTRHDAGGKLIVAVVLLVIAFSWVLS